MTTRVGRGELLHFFLHPNHLMHPPHQHHHDHDHQGWEDLGGENCYKLMLDQWVSWGEAHTNCWMEVNNTFPKLVW